MSSCELEVRNVFCSSESRNLSRDPYGNSYTLHLTTPIKDVTKVELLFASVPNTLYNLNVTKKLFGVSNVLVDNTAPVQFFSVPPGFYSGPSLAFELQNAVSNLTDVSIQYLVNEGKFLFTRPKASVSNSFSINSGTAELSGLLGFSSSKTQVSIPSQTPAAYGGTTGVPLYVDNERYADKHFIKSDHVANLNPNEGIFLDIEELRTIMNEDALGLTDGTGTGYYSGENMRRSFGLIPMDVSSGAVKRFKKTSDFDFCIDYPRPIEKLSRLTVRWVDKNGKVVNFNGLEDNSFLLRCHTLRKNLC